MPSSYFSDSSSDTRSEPVTVVPIGPEPTFNNSLALDLDGSTIVEPEAAITRFQATISELEVENRILEEIQRGLVEKIVRMSADSERANNVERDNNDLKRANKSLERTVKDFEQANKSPEQTNKDYQRLYEVFKQGRKYGVRAGEVLRKHNQLLRDKSEREKGALEQANEGFYKQNRALERANEGFYKQNRTLRERSEQAERNLEQANENQSKQYWRSRGEVESWKQEVISERQKKKLAWIVCTLLVVSFGVVLAYR
ncbi:MAG: hypothetical protein Q9220_007607 [cf. Caloplaca sp. 1 TL-2023]